MKDSIEDDSIGIEYNPIMREYSIDVRRESARICIWYCPWCNTQLPLRVRDVYFKILEEEYDINDDTDQEQMNRLPPEFETDEWWKKRGL